jgi:hypothetical protein
MPLFSPRLLQGILLTLISCFILPFVCLGNPTPSVVSITFTWVDDCAGWCIDGQGHNIVVLQDVLTCDAPVYNYCYCPTDTKSIDSIRSWISQCVSTRCDAVDLSTDISAVESGYASYCIEAGYSQSGATTWFAETSTTQVAAPSTGASPGSPTGSLGTTRTLVAVSTQSVASMGITKSGGSSSVTPFSKSSWVSYYVLLFSVTAIFAWTVPILTQVLTYKFKSS